MSDNTNYYAFADAFVSCYGSDNWAGRMDGYRNGAVYVSTTDNQGSCSNCYPGVSFTVNRGETFKCNAPSNLNGKYYYNN